ncbi:MAG TPA: YoaK family protein, partial [Acidimicrobiales bacterium]|nr:YoaK family protein [Acidimicrobiales bacterium]
PLLVALTLVTGLVDAFSYLVLGHVFVANMTGNVVFLGFALAGAAGFSIGASCAALALFALGALVGGWLAQRLGQRRARLLGAATALQAVVVSASVIVATLSDGHVTSGERYALIVLLAAAMGVQNAAVRRLAVPELTTTVLTMTITGIASDGPFARGSASRAGRRLLAVAAMFVGGLVGAICVLRVRAWAPLALADVALVTVAAVTAALGAGDPAWSRTGKSSP